MEREVDMLIGVDYAYLHCARQEIHGEEGQPVTRLTSLGWTYVGSLMSTRETHSIPCIPLISVMKLALTIRFVPICNVFEK